MSNDFDWGAVGGAITAIGIGIGGVYAWWQNTQKKAAQNRADVAESNADRSVADASNTVYTLLTDRLKRVEAELLAMRGELSAERKHIRRLTMHIWLLEGLMHKANIDPPPFVDDEGTGGAIAVAVAIAAPP